MTFLELCRRVRQDSGISGDIASVTSQQGILAKLVTWVQQAEYDIVSDRTDWNFMCANGQGVLQVGKSEYLPTELGMQSFAAIDKLYVDKQPIGEVNYDYLDDLLLRQGGAENGAPSAFAVTPQRTILLNAKPTTASAVDVRYKKQATRLTGNHDVSPIPEWHQEIIVQGALVHYARHEQDDYLLREATGAYERHMAHLCNSQLPRIQIAGWGG